MLKNESKKIKIFKGKDFQVSYHWAGSIPFEESLKAQEQLKDPAQKSHFCFFGFQTQKPVITMGLRADFKDILWTKDQLKEKEISVLSIKRGGEATLHAPGQLIIYPIVHLPSLYLKVRDWIKSLEQVTQTLFKSLNIKAWHEGPYAGLYTQKGKIAFFGIHISQGVSQHGLSVNVNNDLNLFESIKSCGKEKRTHDSLASYFHASIDLQDLFVSWCNKASSFLVKQ